MDKDCKIAWKKFCKDNSIINENDTSIIRSIFEYAFKEGYSVRQNDFNYNDTVPKTWSDFDVELLKDYF